MNNTRCLYYNSCFTSYKTPVIANSRTISPFSIFCKPFYLGVLNEAWQVTSCAHQANNVHESQVTSPNILQRLIYWLPDLGLQPTTGAEIHWGTVTEQLPTEQSKRISTSIPRTLDSYQWLVNRHSTGTASIRGTLVLGGTSVAQWTNYCRPGEKRTMTGWYKQTIALVLYMLLATASRIFKKKDLLIISEKCDSLGENLGFSKHFFRFFWVKLFLPFYTM